MKLIRHNHLYIADSTVHGRGVFTSVFLKKNTIIEECPHLPLSQGLETLEYVDYRYRFPKEAPTCFSIPLGLGVMYNHRDNNNIDWSTDIKRDLFIFYTLTDIKPDEELFINYGKEWWNYRSNLTKK